MVVFLVQLLLLLLRVRWHSSGRAEEVEDVAPSSVSHNTRPLYSIHLLHLLLLHPCLTEKRVFRYVPLSRLQAHSPTQRAETIRSRKDGDSVPLSYSSDRTTTLPALHRSIHRLMVSGPFFSPLFFPIGGGGICILSHCDGCC